MNTTTTAGKVNQYAALSLEFVKTGDSIGNGKKVAYVFSTTPRNLFILSADGSIAVQSREELTAKGVKACDYDGGYEAAYNEFAQRACPDYDGRIDLARDIQDARKNFASA